MSSLGGWWLWCKLEDHSFFWSTHSARCPFFIIIHFIKSSWLNLQCDIAATTFAFFTVFFFFYALLKIKKLSVIFPFKGETYSIQFTIVFLLLVPVFTGIGASICWVCWQRLCEWFLSGLWSDLMKMGGGGGGVGTLRAKRGNPETVQEHIPNQLIYLLKYYFLSTKQNI